MGYRIAFLTQEFVTESPAGGLGNYVNRMTQALLTEGHTPEVFVVSRHGDETFEHHGVRVHRVAPRHGDWRLRWGYRTAKALRSAGLRRYVSRLAGPLALARALGARERTAPFDLVQSSDFGITGWLVKRKPDRLHLTRCSSPSELLLPYVGAEEARVRRRQARYQRRAVARVDKTYAPSEMLANHFRSKYGTPMAVVRPPLFREQVAPEPAPAEVPERYLFHFGKLCVHKGTEAIARVLPEVWRREPAFSMVWAGEAPPDSLEKWRSWWGQQAGQVSYLGPVSKGVVYNLLTGAEAAVLPSLADNLPNTAIESLVHGIPVVAFANSSIDELVDDGVQGHILPWGDEAALAETLITIWKGGSPVKKGYSWENETRRQMEPANAVRAMLSFGGLEC